MRVSCAGNCVCVVFYFVLFVMMELSSGLREHFFSEWNCKNADGGALHGEVFHMP